MATTINLYAYAKGPGPTSEITGTIDLADVTVNTTPTSTGGWNTASVTADKQREFVLSDADAATAGMPAGVYECFDQAGAKFRLRRR